MPILEVKNTHHLALETHPLAVRDTIAKAFNVSAAKFIAWGPMDSEVNGTFVRENPPKTFMIATDQATADEMMKQRPSEVKLAKLEH